MNGFNKYKNQYGYTITHVMSRQTPLKSSLSWIFVPGGPGFNSSYFIDLVLSL